MNSLVGEAVALVEAMKLARRKRWSRVEFECETLLCQEVISSAQPSWAIAALVVFSKACLVEFSDWRIAWILRP